MPHSRLALLLLVSLLAPSCASPAQTAGLAPAEVREDFGVLVMAHGGTKEWNDGVLGVVEPLRDRYPLEVAFGMADAVSLQDAVAALEARGARRIGVVRLFVSGESWYERTEQILGLIPGAPDRAGAALAVHDASHAHHSHGDGHAVADPGDHGTHRMEFWRLATASSFALTTSGIVEAETMGTILADRARSLSRDAAGEVVLILAHGPADDAENARWLAKLDARAEEVRRALPFRRVEAMTLREDWPEKRAEAERRIRAFVTDAAAEGLTPIVLPFRVHGFGPYAEVLAGLDYIADGHGLIPHPEVTRWIEARIASLHDADFRPVAAR